MQCSNEQHDLRSMQPMFRTVTLLKLTFQAIEPQLYKEIKTTVQARCFIGSLHFLQLKAALLRLTM